MAKLEVDIDTCTFLDANNIDPSLVLSGSVSERNGWIEYTSLVPKGDGTFVTDGLGALARRRVRAPILVPRDEASLLPRWVKS